MRLTAAICVLFLAIAPAIAQKSRPHHRIARPVALAPSIYDCGHNVTLHLSVTLRKYEGPETDIYLEVVMQYEEGEEPWGLYLSDETVMLLSEMGGALDFDAVPLMKKSQGG